MLKKTLTEPEIRRFKLQMNLPGIDLEGQEKLKNARVAVIGAGGTGASVLQYLSSVGVGFFGIVDNGLVDELSMQRQTLYGGTDLGKLKTIISRQRLQTLFPQNEYEIINLKLDKDNSERILQPFDLIIDASNNAETNYIVNDTCIKINKPWIFSAVFGTSVLLSVFNYNEGASLRCYKPSIEYINNVAISFSYACAGIFSSVEAVKIITNQSDILSNELLQFNCFDYTYQIVEVKKNNKNFQTLTL